MTSMEQQHLKMSLEEHQKKEEDCFCGKIRCEAKKEKSNKSKSESTPQQPPTPAMANEPSFPFHHSLKEAIDNQIDRGFDLETSDFKLLEYQKSREAWKDQNVKLFVNNLSPAILQPKPMKPKSLFPGNHSHSTPKRYELEESLLPGIYVASPVNAPANVDNSLITPMPPQLPPKNRFPLGRRHHENPFEMKDLSIVEDAPSTITNKINWIESKEEAKRERNEHICQLFVIFIVLCLIAGFGYFVYWYFFLYPENMTINENS